MGGNASGRAVSFGIGEKKMTERKITVEEMSLMDIFTLIPEREWKQGKSGSKIEVIAGCMFSGKTEEMIRRIKRARIAKQNSQIFKPIIDTRYGGIHKVNSHSGAEDDAIPVRSAREMLVRLATDDNLKDVLVVGIDEAQFFDDGIVPIVLGLRAKGYRVVIAGLDKDFKEEPFGLMSILLTIAEEGVREHAICMVCGGEADYTQRMVNGKPARYTDDVILVGAEESYQARCFKHHLVPGKPRLVPKDGE